MKIETFHFNCTGNLHSRTHLPAPDPPNPTGLTDTLTESTHPLSFFTSEVQYINSFLWVFEYPYIYSAGAPAAQVHDLPERIVGLVPSLLPADESVRAGERPEIRRTPGGGGGDPLLAVVERSDG